MFFACFELLLPHFVLFTRWFTLDSVSPIRLFFTILTHITPIYPITEGTYGVVYKANDLRTSNTVALKYIRLEIDDKSMFPRIQFISALNQSNGSESK